MRINAFSNINFSSELINSRVHYVNRLYKIFAAALFIYVTISITKKCNNRFKSNQIKLYKNRLIKGPFTSIIQQQNADRWALVWSMPYQQNKSWKHTAVKLLRQNYYEKPEEEIERLKGSVLTNEQHENVRQTIEDTFKSTQAQRTPEKICWGKVMLGRALEIKMIFSETHDVFTSSQSTDYLFLSIFLKELIRRQKPHKNIQGMKYFRDMCIFEKKEGLENKIEKTRFLFLRKAANWFANIRTGKTTDHKVRKLTQRPETLKDFIKKHPLINDARQYFDHKAEPRSKLLSLSGYFFDTAYTESSLYFLTHNYNILTRKKKFDHTSPLLKIVSDTLCKTFPTFQTEVLTIYINQIVQALPKEEYPCGNFFVLCIPKEKSKDIVYRAHPYGIMCSCHPNRETDAILKKAQNDEIESIRCKSHSIPQWRAFIPQLENDEEEGKERIHIYRLSPIPKKTRDNLKMVIRNVVDALFTQLEIQNI